MLHHRQNSRKLDLAAMVQWASAHGLLHQIASGPLAGRYVIGPGHWPIMKAWSGGSEMRMIMKRPPKDGLNYYLVAAPGTRDVTMKHPFFSPPTTVHSLAMATHPALIRTPRLLWREYTITLPRGAIDQLAYLFPSPRQRDHFVRLLQKERLFQRIGITAPGSCGHLVYTLYCSPEHPGGRHEYRPCGKPVLDGSRYCEAHQTWEALIPTIERRHEEMMRKARLAELARRSRRRPGSR